MIFQNHRMNNKTKILLMSLITLTIIVVSILYLRTGYLQATKIDHRDLSKWQFDEQGIILQAKEFSVPGSGDVCWYLIHGYTSTPDEMRELADKIHTEFNETVLVTRLKGHGQVPSQLVNLSLVDWYEQVSAEYEILNKNCQKINVVGFSFGGALATKLAENKKVNHLYLLSPYLIARHQWYYLFRPETYLDIFSDILIYSKKTKVAQINSPTGLNNHIAYWNMPFAPVKKSKTFFAEVKSELPNITAPVLLQQSKNDKTSDLASSIYIYQRVSSKNKELITFEKSNHVIMEDYDKEAVMINIIDFEKRMRSDGISSS